jgi:hypothetical protein
MKYKVGDKVVCIKEEEERDKDKPNKYIKLHEIYTIRVDFSEEDNPDVTYNALENIVMLEETSNFHSKKHFISLVKFRKQKLLNIFDDL